ncbi:hypothetical protein DAT36_19735 [Photobacterium phosphoreum]|nr:hypothetical protein DAT36_19735 [Photobacterium phosphoreum]
MRVTGEAFNNLKFIKINQKEYYFIHEFAKSNTKLNDAQADNLVLSTSPRYVMEWLAFFGFILVIVINVIINGHEISSVLPLLTVFGLSTFKLLPSLQQAYNAFTIIKGNISVLDLLGKDIYSAQVNPNKSINNNEMDFCDNIEIRHGFYKYEGKENNALTNICMKINKNEKIGIIGSSGAGKSTLIDILTGLLLLDVGDLFIDGISVNCTRKEWAKNISYVPQVINLLDGTIAENIAFGYDESEIDFVKISEVISLANLDELVISLPDGVHNKIGQNGIQLSGGQRQRLGIARALYTNANVLVFDEATSALDGITEKKIMESIENLSGLKTIILIAHRLNTVKKCNNIYIMEGGEVIDSGNYEYLVKHNEYFNKLAMFS